MKKPELIGKYYSLENIKYLDIVFSRNQLYFSNPGDFNDPFEMSPALPKHKVFKPLNPKLKRLPPEFWNKIYSDFWIKQQSKLKKWGVCCFTESLDNIVMWANYADKHRGICLIFNTKFKFFQSLKDVDYLPGRIQMPLLEKRNPQKLISIMRSKSDLWSFEKEWRLFRRFNNRRYVYPKSSLVGIIFGCRCTYEDRDLIYRLNSKRKLKYYETRMSPYEYKLKISEI